MSIFKHSEGVVTQVWRDVNTLEEFNDKYTGVTDVEEGDAIVGQLWDGTNLTDPPVQITSDMIGSERDRRIALGFAFDGNTFQADDGSLRKINGAATGAIIAKSLGADGASTNWADGGTEFSWVATDNTIVPMSPDTVLMFGMAAMAHVDAHTKAARVLKDAPAADYADDAHWPTGI